MIHASQLTKTYRVPVKAPGLAASLRSLWHREYRDVHAVEGVELHVEAGERIAAEFFLDDVLDDLGVS